MLIEGVWLPGGRGSDLEPWGSGFDLNQYENLPVQYTEIFVGCKH